MGTDFFSLGADLLSGGLSGVLYDLPHLPAGDETFLHETLDYIHDDIGVLGIQHAIAVKVGIASDAAAKANDAVAGNVGYVESGGKQLLTRSRQAGTNTDVRQDGARLQVCIVEGRLNNRCKVVWYQGPTVNELDFIKSKCIAIQIDAVATQVYHNRPEVEDDYFEIIPAACRERISIRSR